MRRNKIGSIIFLCVLAVLIVSIQIIYFFLVPMRRVMLVQSPTKISQNNFHPGNNRQHISNVWLGCYNGQLYYFCGEKISINLKKYNSSLFVFQEGKLVEVAQLSRGNNNISILGIVDNFIYYRENNIKDYTKQKLYCYNLESNEVTLIFSGKFNTASSKYFANDGSAYFPLMPVSGEKAQFVHVSGQNMRGLKLLTDGYPLGDSVYYVVSEYSDSQVERIIKTDLHDNIILTEVSFEPAYDRSVIPYADGLIVHNEGLNSLLYKIDMDGNVTELFNVPCLGSESAVNTYKSDAYISVLRYEKYGEKGMLRYENDLVEGTYRISLIDGSIEKVNNMCFVSIYNFDDTCFYCCDKQGNVYKMEFDGTINPILLFSE